MGNLKQIQQRYAAWSTERSISAWKEEVLAVALLIFWLVAMPLLVLALERS